MNGLEMFRQTTNKPSNTTELDNRTNKWSKLQADARCPNSKKQLEQVTTPKTTSIKKTTLYSTCESRENLNSFSLSIVSEIFQTEYARF